MDLTNDLGQILLIVLGTLGGVTALLFLLAAIEPQPDKTRPSRPRVL